MARVFISYNSRDRKIARRFGNELKKLKHTIVVDVDEWVVGAASRDAFMRVLADSDVVVPAWAIGIEEVLTAPRSPWQNPYVERIVGSIRHDCLDQAIIFNETHLRRVLSCYFRYCHRSRTHLSLNKDCPDPRSIQPPSAGKIVEFPEVGGLHHRYERRAA